MRALPAGPSLIDMQANVAFVVGLTMALAPQMDWMARSMPFEFARRNFYAAARQGLEAVLLWPSSEAPSPRPWPAAELVRRLIPAARAGLTGCGVAAAEADALLGVAGRAGPLPDHRGRLAAAGARVVRGRGSASRDEALAAMTEAYMERGATGAPCHEWDRPGLTARVRSRRAAPARGDLDGVRSGPIATIVK